ncbi:MAG TPA: type IIL restriction-modification enzyme MmeI, partial [Ktedonobacterales bacterium]|nr:type IIL restriction-modification enzyme MmeI [Ktedonobacterales bacterium]
MTPDEFVARWENTTLTERAAAQSHFIELCRLLQVPTPTEADPQGEFYTFEKQTDKDTGHRGFADVWYKEHFAWEYKKPQRDLDAALAQLRQYAGALGNPPLLVVSDMRRIRVITQFTNYVTRTREIPIADLRDAKTREWLHNLWINPLAFRPDQTREQVTEA